MSEANNVGVMSTTGINNDFLKERLEELYERFPAEKLLPHPNIEHLMSLGCVALLQVETGIWEFPNGVKMTQEFIQELAEPRDIPLNFVIIFNN